MDLRFIDQWQDYAITHKSLAPMIFSFPFLSSNWWSTWRPLSERYQLLDVFIAYRSSISDIGGRSIQTDINGVLLRHVEFARTSAGLSAKLSAGWGILESEDGLSGILVLSQMIWRLCRQLSRDCIWSVSALLPPGVASNEFHHKAKSHYLACLMNHFRWHVLLFS